MPQYPHIEFPKPPNQPRMTQAALFFAKTDAEPLGPNRVVTQTLQDLFGTKDVQDAIMASYVWLADQLGHITLGGVFTLLWCWLIYALMPEGTARSILYIAGTVTVFAVWFWKERVDFSDVKKRAGGSVFNFNSSDIEWNVNTALFYFAFGGLMALAPFFGGLAFLASLLLWIPAVFIGYWWLRRKIAFQQAALPYLFRVANFKGNLSDEERRAIHDIADVQEKKVSVWDVIFMRTKAADAERERRNKELNPRHLVISGPLASRKTSLAVGIGTEFAFGLGIGRYLSAVKLLELAVKYPRGYVQMEPDDGRILWPWRSSDLLIVDDVDVGLALDVDGQSMAGSLVPPDAFKAALIRILGDQTPPLDWLAQRRSVWVVGDPTRAAEWRDMIATLIGIKPGNIMLINLQQPAPAQAAQPEAVAGEPPSRRFAGKAAVVVGAFLLLLSADWWWGEGVWGRFQPLDPAHAFADGSFGLELAPLKYFLVMAELSAKPMGMENPSDLAGHFGFVGRADANTGKCIKDAPGNLPVGFSVSNRLPLSASPVPVKFVGLTCAACHSTQVRNLEPIMGAATQTADLIGFQDALSSAVLDKNLNADKILSAYDKQCGQPDTPVITFIPYLDRQLEAVLINRWLGSAREAMRRYATKYDMAFSATGIADPANIPTGPSRSRPFRSAIRNALDFPAETNHAISKMPAVFMQRYKNWAQYDGSIRDPVVRSAVAIFASGASIPALNERQIFENIRRAAEFTANVGEDPKVPKLSEAFPEDNAPEATVKRGEQVYMDNCYSCHGHKEPGGWVMPTGRPDPDITPLDVIKTDPARVKFRYVEMLPPALLTLFPSRNDKEKLQMIADMAKKKKDAGETVEADWWSRFIDASSESSAVKSDILDFSKRSQEFPAGHRLAKAFAIGEVVFRNEPGYQSTPIPFVWLRAPYLHNGSVPTLRALIGLDKRPPKFCRGRADYDTKAVGIPVIEPGAEGCKAPTPFLYDAQIEGNSNQGHDFPVPEKHVTTQGLEDLLAYLRTI